MKPTKRIAIETIGLQTSRGRLAFFTVVSFIVFLLPIKTLAGFSLWGKIGFDLPSIGLTRAYHYVLHGNFEQAWQQNGLVFIVLLIGLPLLIKDVYNVVKQLIAEE